MTGLHALHVTVGVGLLSVMAWLASRRRFSATYYKPIEVSGLYWHFVDIVWIFLYPLLLPHKSLLMNSTILPRKMYFAIWAALMVLLALTWGIAQVDLGVFNVVVALTIAIIKMLLVILFFMHVRYSRGLTWLFAAAGFIWLMIMIDLTLGDYLTRQAVGR